MSTRSRTSLVSLAVLAALTLSACGSGGSGGGSTASDPAGDPSPTSASPGTDVTSPPDESPGASATSSLPATDDPTVAVELPTCASVWVVGQTFPPGYEGCLEGTKTIQADGLYCEFGKPLFSYGKHFYAVPNGPVNRTEQTLARDKAFQKAQRSCGG